MLKRFADVVLAGTLLVLLSPLLLALWLLVKVTSKGPALYWSERVGQYNKIFLMPKYRSMLTETPQVATHLLSDPASFITPVGGWLRKTSLDELPQLWSILTGKLSFVGPRPALFNQHDLVELRTRYGIEKLVPGLTGWSQINGRDDLSIPAKVEFDRQYLERQSFWFDCRIMVLTAVGVVRGSGVHH